MILEVQIQIFGAHAGARAYTAKRTPAHARQRFQFSKNYRGPKYKYLFVKIGMKLPFTLKNKRRKTNLKFEF